MTAALTMWRAPHKPGCGTDAEFNVGTSRYLADFGTGLVEVAPRHVAAALESGWIAVHHPEAVAGLAAQGAR